jgi:hypothetical protein
MPTDCLNDRLSIIPNQIAENRDEFKKQLNLEKKEICLKFEVLNNDFLMNLNQCGSSKILHLCPYCSDYD